MNNSEVLITRGMVIVSCLFAIASVAVISTRDIARRYINVGCIDSFQNASIIRAIEFVSKK